MNCGLARNLSCRFLKVWGGDAYVKKFQPDKLEPKSEKCVFIDYPKETVGYTFYHRSEGKTFVAKIRKLSGEGVSLERSEWEESRT